MNMTGFCENAKDIMQIVGWALLIFKLIIPIIIILLGALDLGKAVTADKDDEIKKSTKSLGMRIIAGLIIYLIPISYLDFWFSSWIPRSTNLIRMANL